MLMEAFLGFQVGAWDYVTSCTTLACAARATTVQHMPKDLCGWAGVGVAPMTKTFAERLGMAETYGAIFDRPEPGGPAERAGIEQGDVLAAINGSPLMRSSDFANIISAMAPGTAVYFDISRNGEAMQVRLNSARPNAGRGGELVRG